MTHETTDTGFQTHFFEWNFCILITILLVLIEAGRCLILVQVIVYFVKKISFRETCIYNFSINPHHTENTEIYLRHWNITDYWNSYKEVWMIRISTMYTVDIMGAYDLTMQGARASAAIVCPQYSSVSARKVNSSPLNKMAAISLTTFSYAFL